MTEKIGIIDCGTNTFHLMIAETSNERAEIIERIKIPVKIGAGGINKNEILPEAIDRAVDTMSMFKQMVFEKKINKILAFATSAFRNAKNGKQVRDVITKATGIELQIISGDREAELIYKGVNYALSLKKERALIIDIGGGSVEFIIGAYNEILWKKSFEIGGQRLLEMFHKNDPIQVQEIAAIHDYLDNQLVELFVQLDKYHPTLLAGSSGTFDTLSEIFIQKSGLTIDSKSAELPLTFDAYMSIHHDLITMNRSNRLKIPGMIEMRVDMIVVASCLINFLLSKYTFKKLRVSTYSLKEGVLAELIGKE